MKSYIYITTALLLTHFAYAQESLFKNINEKGIGTFQADGQLFFINQKTKDSGRDAYDNNATSFALTLNYNSPIIKNFSLGASYIQAINFQEYSSIDAEAADAVQNGSFGILNNAFIKYNFKALGFEKGSIVAGRFPLDTEFLTGNKIRIKEQAYEGAYIDIKDISNWSLKAGYIDRFSSWRSTRYDFRDISRVYSGDSIDGGQIFAEIGYEIPEKTKFDMYYLRTNGALNTIGLNYNKRVIDSDGGYRLNAIGKGIVQWDPDNKHFHEASIDAVGAIQTALLFGRGDLNVEVGSFVIPWNKSGEADHVIAPFGPNLIISTPLIGANIDYALGNNSFYVESTYKISKLSFYLLYLHTQNTYGINENYVDEIDVITSYAITNRLNLSVKTGYINQNLEEESQFLDFRVFLKYNF